MAGQLILMERGGSERMNVPVEKLDEYLADGWREIFRQTLITPAPLDVAQALPTPAAVEPPAPAKGRGKSK